MAQSKQRPRNLPSNEPAAPLPVATDQTAVDAERLAKARAARMENIPPEERALMDQIEGLRETRKTAPAGSDQYRDLTRRIAAAEKSRKEMAFKRSAADLFVQCKKLSKRLESLAGSNYAANDRDRAKFKMLVSGELSRALALFDKQPDIEIEGGSEMSASEKRRQERAQASSMLFGS